MIKKEHYYNRVEQIKELKRQGKHKKAIAILLQCVDLTEAESNKMGEGYGVAPWYYEQLAIIYRKEKRIEDEIAILERYQQQEKGPGKGPSKLAKRLEKARKRVT